MKIEKTRPLLSARVVVKFQSHAAAVALHYMHYNFERIHRTLRITPAMAAGLTGHVWSIEEIVGLLEIAEKPAA